MKTENKPAKQEKVMKKQSILGKIFNFNNKDSKDLLIYGVIVFILGLWALLVSFGVLK